MSRWIGYMQKVFSTFVIVLVTIMLSGVASASEITYETKDEITRAIPDSQASSDTKRLKKKGKKHKKVHKKFSRITDPAEPF
jgi:hypothetical protein